MVPHGFAACWCNRWGGDCSALATQEDMLCDTCRAGCSLLTFKWENGAYSCTEHAKPVVFNQEPWGNRHLPDGTQK